MAKPTRNLSKKPPKCVKGWSCGRSCIARGRRCRNPLEGQAKTLADYLLRQSAPPAPIVYPLTHEGDIARGKALLGDEDVAFIESLKDANLVQENEQEEKARIVALAGQDPEVQRLAGEYETSATLFENTAREIYATNNPTSEQMEKFEKEKGDYDKSLDALVNARMAAEKRLVAEFQLSSEGQKRLARTARVEAIHKKMMDSSSLTETQAFALVDSQVTLPRGWKKKYPELRDQYMQYARMTNGKGLEEQISVKISTRRAYASSSDKTISVHSFDNSAALWHEAAHWIEFNLPETKTANVGWLTSRATGPVTPIRYLEGNGSRRSLNEVAVPDKFITPYVGRIYPVAGSTEVISMAVERFRSPSALRELFTGDPEHFFLALGQIRR